jgi:type II secretory pathway pseudopilin PulG
MAAKQQCRTGVTLVELLVVSTIMVLIASLTLPVSQIMRQREKENRLRDILRQIRDQGIGLGAQMDGYANYVSSQINMLASDAARYALATATSNGLLYPRNPSMLENPAGEVLKIATDSSGGLFTLRIPGRFIRKVPPHPFIDWYPGAHWEFKAVATDSTAGLGTTIWWASASTAPWNQVPPDATGVIDIRSRGAGLSLDGTNTDDW